MTEPLKDPHGKHGYDPFTPLDNIKFTLWGLIVLLLPVFLIGYIAVLIF